MLLFAEMKAWDDLIDAMDITDQDIKEIYQYHNQSESSDAARRNILYLWTLETPLYGAVNKANQYHDETCIETLGPYAWLVFMSLWHSPDENKKAQEDMLQDKTDDYGVIIGTITLYRGLGLPEKAIEEYEALMGANQKDGKPKEFAFTGFTSTSWVKEVAV